MYIWRKFIAPPGVSAWLAQVGLGVDADRLAVIAPSNGSRARLEIYCATPDEARTLARRFGGQVRELADERWQPPPATARGKPLSLGGRLLVTAWPDELAGLRSGQPAKRVLCIPAAMAFGTGEHATTAMCLRLLAEVSRRRQPGTWAMLDLGTGSGILALAGSLFGARQALGLDNDRQAVRTANENARLNGIVARLVRFAPADLLRWPLPRDTQWPIVTANLFSDLLIRLLPTVLVPVLAPDGDLILSGVLAEQAEELQTAIRSAGLTLLQVKQRGRWRAFHCCHSARKARA